MSNHPPSWSPSKIHRKSIKILHPSSIPMNHGNSHWEFPWNSHEITMKSPTTNEPRQVIQVAMTPGAATSNAAFTCSERRSSRKALAKARRQRSSWGHGRPWPSPRDETMGKNMGKIHGKMMGKWPSHLEIPWKSY